MNEISKQAVEDDAAEFTDDLTDEALDRQEVTKFRNFPGTGPCTSG